MSGPRSAAPQGPWDAWPVNICIPVAWGEMDAFGHVNNVAYFRYFESARLEYFRTIGFLESGTMPAGIGPILAHTECRFRIPLTWPATLRVTARAGDLGVDRFIMRYAVFDEASGKLAAEGTGRIVAFDYATGAKAPVPESVAARIRELEGAAPA